MFVENNKHFKFTSYIQNILLGSLWLICLQICLDQGFSSFGVFYSSELWRHKMSLSKLVYAIVMVIFIFHARYIMGYWNSCT